MASCLSVGAAIFEAARRLDGSGERAGARILGRLGAAVELAALAAGDQEASDRGGLGACSRPGRLH